MPASKPEATTAVVDEENKEVNGPSDLRELSSAASVTEAASKLDTPVPQAASKPAATARPNPWLGNWLELDTDNCPENNKPMFCETCGTKNRNDEGWRFRALSQQVRAEQLERMMQRIASNPEFELKCQKIGMGSYVSSFAYECERCRDDDRRVVYSEA